MPQISASILAANHVYIARDVVECEKQGVDSIHVDITDGHYTDNLTFGPQTVEDLRKVTSLPIDVHLGIFNQDKFINQFIDLGADMITLQYESCLHPFRTINSVKERGIKVCMAFAPKTSFIDIKPIIKYVDQVNVLAVEPGFGGQSFLPETLDKVIKIKQYTKDNDFPTQIAVDGGLNENTIKDVVHSGADNLIMGSMLFDEGFIEKNIKKIRECVKDFNA